jgi:hypothetical protein
MALSKYIKQPITGNLAGYTDNEFRKIETVFSNFLIEFQELQEMALQESGAFVPTITGTTVAGVGTYTRQECKYYKIGRLVIAFFRVTTSAHTGTGAIKIDGFPYPAANVVGGDSTFSARLYGTGEPVALLAQNTTYLTPYGAGGVPVPCGGAMDFTGSIVYFVD